MKYLLGSIFLITNLVYAQKQDTLEIGKTTYVGEVINDQINGFGKEFRKGELIYEGNFTNSYRHGKGIFYNGHLTEQGIWEEGYLKYGTITSSLNGEIWEGNWDNFELVNGTILFTNGIKVDVSTTKNLDAHGQGVINYSDGTKVKTTWKKGRPFKKGTIHYPNGKTIEGKWQRKKLNEIVLIVNIDGVDKKAELSDGTIIRFIKD